MISLGWQAKNGGIAIATGRKVTKIDTDQQVGKKLQFQIRIRLHGILKCQVEVGKSIAGFRIRS